MDFTNACGLSFCGKFDLMIIKKLILEAAWHQFGLSVYNKHIKWHYVHKILVQKKDIAAHQHQAKSVEEIAHFILLFLPLNIAKYVIECDCSISMSWMKRNKYN